MLLVEAPTLSAPGHDSDSPGDEFKDRLAGDNARDQDGGPPGGDVGPPSDVVNVGSTTHSQHWSFFTRALNRVEVQEFREAPDQRGLVLNALNLTEVFTDTHTGRLSADLENVMKLITIESNLMELHDQMIDRSPCYLARWFGHSSLSNISVDGVAIDYGTRRILYDQDRQTIGGYQRLMSSQDEGSQGWNVVFMYLRPKAIGRPELMVPVPPAIEARISPPPTPAALRSCTYAHGTIVLDQPQRITDIPPGAEVHVIDETTPFNDQGTTLATDGETTLRYDFRIGHTTRSNSFRIVRTGNEVTITPGRSNNDFFLKIGVGEHGVELHISARPSI